MDPLSQLLLIICAASFALALVATVRARRTLTIYGALSGAALVAAAFALWRSPSPLLVMAVYTAFGWLIVLPILLAGLIRRQLRLGNWKAALRLARARQLVQPGTGMARELETLAALDMVRQGRREEVVAAIEERLASCRDDLLRLAIFEQLLTLHLYARDFEAVVERFEQEGGVSLASASLGICVTMVRAYAETGDFEKSARCLAIVEQSAAAMSHVSAVPVNGARLAFVAHLGLVEHLDQILGVAPSFLPELAPEHVKLWRGLALARCGEAESAEQQWREAIDETKDPEVVRVAEQRLERDLLAKIEPPDSARKLADLAAERAGIYHRVPRSRGRLRTLAPVTFVLLLGIGLVHLIAELSGNMEDPWQLLRLGANFRLAVFGGEVWRLLTSAFLHGNLLHLCLNAYALFLLGRLAEQMYGSARFFSIYCLAGVAGAAASAMRGGMVHLSVGASGAIFGLIGAALVGLHTLRGQVPEQWRKQLTYNLLIIIALQAYIGATVEVIDNAAHVGGLVGGAVASLLLRPPKEDEPRWLAGFTRGLALALVVAVIGSYALLVTNGPAEMLRRLPTKVMQKGGLRVACPAHWIEVSDPEMLVAVDPLLGRVRTLEVAAPYPMPVGMTLEKFARRETEERTAAWDERQKATIVERGSTAEDGLVITMIRIQSGQETFISTSHYRQQDDLILILRFNLPEGREKLYTTTMGSVSQSLRFEDKTM